MSQTALSGLLAPGLIAWGLCRSSKASLAHPLCVSHCCLHVAWRTAASQQAHLAAFGSPLGIWLWERRDSSGGPCILLFIIDQKLQCRQSWLVRWWQEQAGCVPC